jgi:hypothetical protein
MRTDPDATWLTDLVPAFADRFPFDPDCGEIGGLWVPEVVEPAPAA